MRRSLRAQLTLTLVALTVLPLLLVGGLLAWQGFEVQRQQAIDLQREVAERAAVQLTTFLSAADAELRLLIQNPDFKSDDQVRRAAALSQALFYKNTFDELALLDEAGREQLRISRLGVSPEAELGDRSSSPEFTAAMRGNRTYYGAVFASKLSGEPLMLVAVPTLDAVTGQPNGVLVAAIRLQQVWYAVTNIAFGQGGGVLIADQSGEVIGHRDPELLRRSPRIDVTTPDGIARDLAGRDVVRTTRPVSLNERLLYIVAEQPADRALAHAYRTIMVAGGALLLAAAVAAALSLTLVSRLVRPLRALAHASQAISQGDLQEVAVTRHDEIGVLQREFSLMARNLRAQRAAIEERSAELEASVAAQRQLLRTVDELSTPLLPVWDSVLVLPVVGHVDERRGAQMVDTLARGVAAQRARVAILDITGIAAVGPEAITAIVRAMRAVELLGARPILAGISSESARILVEQGLDRGTIATYRDVQTAVESAVATLAREVGRR